MAEGGLGGVFNGIKWGIIINLAAVVLLPLATRFLGTHPGSGGGRPFSSYEAWASSEFGHRKKHGSGGSGGMGWGGD